MIATSTTRRPRVAACPSARLLIAALIAGHGIGLPEFRTPPARAEDLGCTISAPNYCQAFDDSTVGRPSGGEGGLIAPHFTTADDFFPLGSVISSVCVWGAFVAPGASPQAGCDDLPGDDFHVDIHLDDGDGLPGQHMVGSIVSPGLVTRTYVPGTAFEAAHGAPVCVYQFPVGLGGLDPSGQTRYWIKVRHVTARPPNDPAYWVWLTTTALYNDHSAVHMAGSENPATGDLAFCLNVPADEPAEVYRACCQCDVSCSVASQRECQGAAGNWLIGEPTCASFVCPSPPTNATCDNPLSLPGDGSTPIEFDNHCAGTELLAPVASEAGTVTMVNDVWFRFVPDFNVYLASDTCSTLPAFAAGVDTAIAMYHDAANPTVCPCPTDMNPDEFLWPAGLASDGDCYHPFVQFDLGGGGEVFAEACQGNCYLIRVGAVGGSGVERGRIRFQNSLLLPAWQRAGPPVPPADDECYGGSMHGAPCGVPADCPGGQCRTKNRYLSAVLPEDAFPAGLQVRVIDVPSLLPALESALEGTVWWAGTPQVYAEGPTGGSFTASILQCDAYYDVWSTPLSLHVTGAMVIPETVYELWWCLQDQPLPCKKGPSCWLLRTVKTNKWCDIVPPLVAGQPDFGDIAAVVDKFTSRPEAVGKRRAQLQPNSPNPAANVNFLDISACVSGFQGGTYPFAGPAPCP